MCVCMHGWMDGWMYVCIYVCMYLGMYVCMYVCMRAKFARIRVGMHACLHVCIFACTHAGMHACFNPCMHVHMYACLRMYACMHGCMYVCVCAHPCTKRGHAYFSLFISARICLEMLSNIHFGMYWHMFSVLSFPMYSGTNTWFSNGLSSGVFVGWFLNCALLAYFFPLVPCLDAA